MEKIIEEKSPLLAEKLPDISEPEYTDEEKIYLSALLRRVQNTMTIKEQEHSEFDGMTYSEWHDSNRKLASNYIEPKKNPEDSNFQSGIARDKLYALLSSINNLNLSPDISAFDQNNIRLGTLGDAMEDIILKTEELDADEEKKFLRQEELLTQGTVFVEEIWDEKWKVNKQVKNHQKFTGQIKGLSWTQILKKAISQPSRNVISGLSVFLGDIRQYFIHLQPYIFTLDIKTRLETEEMFGTWDRWKNVPYSFQPPKFEKEITTYDENWKILNMETGSCAIIRYQDKWNNEFALIINGVLMTSVGLPLSFVNGFEEYSITQQNYEPIHSKFAYGNSLMRKIKAKVGLLDEMLRLGVLKTQQSFKPPLLNLSGRVISRKIFMAGNIIQGADLAGKLVPIIEGQQFGITNSELAMIKKIEDTINSSSVNPTFQGQQTQGNPTATEIVELQRQAKLMLGISIAACSWLEWKLAWLRLFNLIAKWFDPLDEVVEEVKGILIKKNIFRRISVERSIEGEGIGRRITVLTKEQLPTPQEINEAEIELKNQSGEPVRLLFINPEYIKNSKLIWQFVIRPREKITSESSKLLFRAEMADASVIFGQMLNLDFLAEKFARIWGDDPNKLFKKNVPITQSAALTGESPATPIKAPEVKIPGVPMEAVI